ncbi:sugar ABC transporter permease [Blautia schinkii]|nr:sugar ABC transporter permease [Blautia schinkii]
MDKHDAALEINSGTKTKKFVLSEVFNLRRDFDKVSLIVELLLVFITFQILTGGTFMTTRNLSNLLMQGATCSIIAITMMLVIVSQNADLSAGNVLGFMGVVAATMQVNLELGTSATILITLLTGLLVGLWHGFWIGYVKLPAFIVTFATQLIMKGLILLVGGGMSIGPVSPSFAVFGYEYLPNIIGEETGFNLLSVILLVLAILCYIGFSIYNRRKKIKEGNPQYGMPIFIGQLVLVSAAIFLVGSIMAFNRGFSYAVLILVALALVFSFIVKNTKFGRYVFAIGGNRDAARLSGINIELNVLKIYVLHGLVTAVAAIVYLGRVGQAAATSGTGFEFTAISGCVVGGTSILGGRGNIIGVIIGTMLMAALDNGMSLLNLDATFQYIIKGMVLMIAIAIDVSSKKTKK